MIRAALLPLLLLAADPAPADPDSGGRVLLAVALMLVALVLLLAEFLLVSFGILAVLSFACAVGAIAIAFSATPAAGWTLLVLTPPAALLVCWWGSRRLLASRLVPKAEIDGAAGYRHAAEVAGATPGAHGELVTDAMPTGRARFALGEADVTIEGPAATRGAQVTVLRIEGPQIIVIRRGTP
jgi:membrane-bound ClpP family serine protease